MIGSFIAQQNAKYKPWIKTFGLPVLIASGLLIIYAIVGPGLDYFGCYTWMVTDPARLPKVADYPWTLNPTWLVPFMAPFVSMPGRYGYILFMAAMLSMTLYGAYVFKGKITLVLLSAQMFWVLWWGQLEGWAVLALVLAKTAVEKGSWWMMFLALLMGSFKPQIGFVPVLAYWWWSGRNRWKSMSALIVVAVLSVVIWGPWPVWYFQGIIKFAGDGHAAPWNASIGLAALPLFIPALLVPLSRDKRIIALTATALLVSPYMPYYSTILLLCLNIPLFAYIFAFTGYLPTIIGTTLAWNIIVLLPVSVLIWVYYPYIKQLLVQFSEKLNHQGARE